MGRRTNTQKMPEETETTEESESLLKDSTFNLVSQVVGLVFAIASGIVLARMLGAEARGEYGMLVLLPQTAVALLAGGISPAVAYGISSKKWDQRDVLPLTLGLCGYASALGLAAIGLMLVFRDVLLGGLPLALLMWAVLIYPATLCLSALQGIYIGQRRFRLQMKCAVAATICSFVLLLIPVVILQWGIVGAIYGHIAGLICSIVIYAVCVRGIVDGSPWQPEWRWRRIVDSFSYGGKASAANALAFLNYRLDQFFVNSMVGTAGVGIYALAVSIVEKLWLLAGNLATAMFPRVASCDGDSSEATELTTRVAGLLMLALIVAGTAAWGLAHLIPYVYGDEFAGSVAVLQWLLPGCVLIGQAKIFSNYFAGRGRPEINVLAGGVGLVVNIVANLILIPRMGVVGAAAATSLSYAAIAAICYGCFAIQCQVKWYAPLIPRQADLRMIAERFAVLFRRVSPSIRSNKA